VEYVSDRRQACRRSSDITQRIALTGFAPTCELLLCVVLGEKHVTQRFSLFVSTVARGTRGKFFTTQRNSSTRGSHR